MFRLLLCWCAVIRTCIGSRGATAQGIQPWSDAGSQPISDDVTLKVRMSYPNDDTSLMSYPNDHTNLMSYVTGLRLKWL